ncbi:MAG TPA: alpha/beta hydrolase, partial [Methyloceanibacter sp.]|nr:alpha/beta hydrolase [Methyloceanibacter sp.]
DGRPLRLEYRWIGRERHGAPLVVFLHEGLGSIAAWRDYPLTLCEAGGFRGLVYSRPGYGRSSPRAPGERWAPDYLHRQAREVLPALLQAAGAGTEKPWLFGHSDGGTIALLYAASMPDALKGAIVVAPHYFVEQKGVTGIAKAKLAYETTDFRDRLSTYHVDPDSAFYGWCDAWLSPEFRDWNIEKELGAISCPLLAVQGIEDEYATMQQIDGIKAQAPQTELLKIPACRHSPHRDHPEILTRATVDFIRRHEKTRYQAVEEPWFARVFGC